MNKKRNILIVFLLLAIVVAGYFFLCNKKKTDVVTLPSFSLQGSTEISFGELSLTIWDNEAEDGDTVKVFLDGKLIRDSLELLNRPLELNFGKLSKGTHQLGVSAISEGMNSPATATIGLTSGQETHEFVMNATLDSAASWNIIIK